MLIYFVGSWKLLRRRRQLGVSHTTWIIKYNLVDVVLDPSLLHDYVFPNVGDEQQRHDDVCVDNIMTVVWESQSIPDDRRHDAHKFHILLHQRTSHFSSQELEEPWCTEMPKQCLGTLVQSFIIHACSMKIGLSKTYLIIKLEIILRAEAFTSLQQYHLQTITTISPARNSF